MICILKDKQILFYLFCLSVINLIPLFINLRISDSQDKIEGLYAEQQILATRIANIQGKKSEILTLIAINNDYSRTLLDTLVEPDYYESDPSLIAKRDDYMEGKLSYSDYWNTVLQGYAGLSNEDRRKFLENQNNIEDLQNKRNCNEIVLSVFLLMFVPLNIILGVFLGFKIESELVNRKVKQVGPV